MKLGIALFCTGKYRMFLDEYVKSCEKYFLPNTQKTYFIFTDDPVSFENISYRYIEQKKIGWPLDTLKRYAIINQHENLFDEMDYILVTNANFVFNELTEEHEVIPLENDNWLASVDHPMYFDKEMTTELPYERNPESSAYVAFGDEKKYLQACFVLGRKQEFFQLSRYVEFESEKDLKKNFISRFWDESYINKYWLTISPRVLPPSYCYPDPRVYSINADKKIIMLEKGLYGGHDFLRSV